MEATSAYVNEPRFTNTFELPADPTVGRASPFKVGYADYGYRNEAHPEEENVLLFFGPLLGSRLLHIAQDELARKHKVRVINPDRPGIGLTDAADAEHKMAIWRDVIPALLRHLEIQHVFLGCQSAGTFYALDTLLHHPEIIHPERPYLAIGGPWILPSHTNSTTLSIAQSLPAGIIASTDKLANLLVAQLGPVLGVTFGFSQAVVAKLTPKSSESDNVPEREGSQFEDDLRDKMIERVYQEGVQGLSSETLLVLQKTSPAGWSDWGDYDVLVPRLAEKLRAAGKRLTIDVFYARSDFLIGDGGTKGPLWFDECWAEQHRGDVIDYSSTIVEGADHDSVWNLRWGVPQKVFAKIGQSVEQPE